MAHPVLFPPSLRSVKWFGKDPMRIFLWMDLVSLAAPVDRCAVMLEDGQRIECGKGTVVTTRGLLAKRWKMSREQVKNFLSLAVREKLMTVVTTSKYSQITICGYDEYVPSDTVHNEIFTHEITHPKTSASDSKSDTCDDEVITELPTFLPTPVKVTHPSRRRVTHPKSDTTSCKSTRCGSSKEAELPTLDTDNLPTSVEITHPNKEKITHPKTSANNCKSDNCGSVEGAVLPTLNDDKLPTPKKVTHIFTHPASGVNDCKSGICGDDVRVNLPTFLPTQEIAEEKVTHKITHLGTSASDCKSEDCENKAGKELPTFLPTPPERQEMKETENEKVSPTPPIKEKDKESKEFRLLTQTVGFSKAETEFPAHTHTCAGGHTLTPEKARKAEERKAKAEARKQKQIALVTKGRHVFEAFFKEQYGEDYYWEAKDAMAMKQVFQKITFRRQQRNPPLPVDDDSLVDAFRQFLHSINKTWVINNFSMTKINSQYNDIISEIQNQKRYGNTTNRSIAGQSRLESQAVAILNDIAKADELYYRNKREGR